MCQYIREYEELQGKSSLICVRNLIQWETPGDSFVKVNFDVAFRERNHRFGSGIVVRDAYGQILGLKVVINNNIPSPFAAEALACVQSVQYGKYLGFGDVIMEGNSLSIIKNIQSVNDDRLIMMILIINIYCEYDPIDLGYL